MLIGALECNCNVFQYRLRESGKKNSSWTPFIIGEDECFKQRADRVVSSVYWNQQEDTVVYVDFKRADGEKIIESYSCGIEIFRDMSLEIEKVELDERA